MPRMPEKVFTTCLNNKSIRDVIGSSGALQSQRRGQHIAETALTKLVFVRLK
jgi:hypothetical protein